VFYFVSPWPSTLHFYIADSSVYFKTNPCTLEAYKEIGMQPFNPFAKQTFKNYYEVPEDILGDDDELAGWARNVRGNDS
jgi:TfoX/Sxy family transcriptional regulator of competence genes